MVGSGWGRGVGRTCGAQSGSAGGEDILPQGAGLQEEGGGEGDGVYGVEEEEEEVVADMI